MLSAVRESFNFIIFFFCFVKKKFLSFFLVKKGGTWMTLRVPDGSWGFLTGDMEDMVVPENLALISVLEVRQEGGVKKGVLGGLLEASRRKTSRMGSSLRSWMTLGESKDHILKVSWHYLYFWRRYKKSLFLRKSVTDRRTDGQTLLQFNIDFPLTFII